MPSLRMSGQTPEQCLTNWPDIGKMSDWIGGDFLVAKPVLKGTHICVCLPFNRMLLLDGTLSLRKFAIQYVDWPDTGSVSD